MQNYVSQIRDDANIPAPALYIAHMTAPYPIDETAEPGIPEGFRRLGAGGPYFRLMGPVYTRKTEAGTAIIALRVAEHHLNIQGVTHGGMLTTLADSALGINLALARGRRGAPGHRLTHSGLPVRRARRRLAGSSCGDHAHGPAAGLCELRPEGRRAACAALQRCVRHRRAAIAARHRRAAAAGWVRAAG